MTRAITKVTSSNEGSPRRWPILAFFTGMVFMAVLAQTIVTVPVAPPALKNGPVIPASSGDYDTLTPDNIPGGGYLVKNDTCGLVLACPAWEAIIPV